MVLLSKIAMCDVIKGQNSVKVQALRVIFFIRIYLHLRGCHTVVMAASYDIYELFFEDGP